MADEVLKPDANNKFVAGAITDDSNQYIKMLRIDDTTKGLKVMIVGGTGAGTVTSVTAGTGLTATASNPITDSGTIALNSKLAPLDTLGTANQQIRVNAGATALEYFTPSAGSGTVTSVSVTTANGVSGSVATATTTPAITITLGAITPTTVNGITLTTSTGTITLTNGKTLTISDSTTLGTASILFANGKTLTVSNTLTLAGTDGKGINVGAATSGKILIGDGSNMVLSTPTYPTAAGTSGNVLTSDGTNWNSAAPSASSGIGWSLKEYSTASSATGITSGTIDLSTDLRYKVIVQADGVNNTTTQYYCKINGVTTANSYWENVEGRGYDGTTVTNNLQQFKDSQLNLVTSSNTMMLDMDITLLNWDNTNARPTFDFSCIGTGNGSTEMTNFINGVGYQNTQTNVTSINFNSGTTDKNWKMWIYVYKIT